MGCQYSFCRWFRVGFSWRASHCCRAMAEPWPMVTHHHLSPAHLALLRYWCYREKYHLSLALLNMMTEFPQTLSIERPESTHLLALMFCHNSFAANQSLTSGIHISKHANSSVRKKQTSEHAAGGGCGIQREVMLAVTLATISIW